MKIKGEQEALQYVISACNKAECCYSDLRLKLQKRGIDNGTINNILKRLTDQGLIDEARYAYAYAHDKMRYNLWGRIKIEQALISKHINHHFIAAAFKDIPHSTYRTALITLLTRKERTMRNETGYTKKMKLLRFAVSHGFTSEEILSVLPSILSENIEQY